MHIFYLLSFRDSDQDLALIYVFLLENYEFKNIMNVNLRT